MDIIRKMHKQEINNAMGSISKYIEQLEEDNSRLKEDLRNYSKEVEISELNDKINVMRKHALHIFTEYEHNKFREFQTNHYKECKSSSSEVTVRGTGLGNIVTVKCPKCQECEDITEFDKW